MRGFSVSGVRVTIISLSLVLASALPKAFAQEKSVEKSADKAVPAVTLASPQSSRAVLNRLMSDPWLHQIYLEQQLRNLTHPVDRALRTFLMSDPRLEQLYYSVLRGQENFLSDFQHYADVSMYRLTRGVTKAYDRLDHIVEETARDLGFSQEAIDNRTVYIKDGGGTLNAFTVSGSQEKIIIVVHSALVEKLDEFEIRAVLGHEMGHIRASHPVNGYLLDGLYSIIYKIYTRNGHESSAMFEGEFLKFSKYCTQHDRNHENANDQITDIDHLLGSNFRSHRISAFDGMLREMLKVVMNIPEAERIGLLQYFMELNIMALKEMAVPKETIEFFEELAQNLPKAGVIRIDAEQMREQLSEAADAISRAQESSADRFGSSVSKNTYLASSMGKLLGLNFTIENREALLKALMKQAENFYQNVSEEDRAYYMGGSHPVPVLRTHMIMNFSNTPDIFFANPYISLLILELGVVEEINQLNTRMSNPKMKAPLRAKFKAQIDHLSQMQKEVDHSIITQLLDTEQKLRGGNRNPRFDNLMQFVIFNKENLYELRNSVDEALKRPDVEGSAKAVKSLTLQKTMIEDSLNSYAEPLLKNVKAALETLLAQSQGMESETKKSDLHERIRQIELALRSPKTSEDLREIRSLRFELSTLTSNRTRGSRIPIECRHLNYE